MNSTNTELFIPGPELQGETGAECEILLPEYCPNLLRILQTTATATLQSVEPSGDRLRIEGSVCYSVLYLPEEGTGIQTVSQQTPFSCSIETKIGENPEYKVQLKTKGCVARALNPKKIFVRSSVSVTVATYETAILSCGVPTEEYETKHCKREALQFLSARQKPLRISDEFETDPGKTVARILQNRITFRPTEQRPLVDKLIAKAEMVLELLCLSPDNTVFSLRKIFPVSQILDLPNVDTESLCTVSFEALSVSIAPKEDAEEGAQLIGYDVEINVSAFACKKIEADWIEDAYSLKKQTECTARSLEFYRPIPVEERGSIRETTDIGSFASVLWADARADLKTLRYKEETDTVLCEGVWNLRILMTDEEGTPCTAERELPFALERPANGERKPVRNETVLQLSEISWSAKDATHVEICGNYQWNGIIFCSEQATAVIGVKETDPREKSPNAITLYYADEGESAWEIAKAYGCPYGDLLRANKLQKDRLEEDTVLLIITA